MRDSTRRACRRMRHLAAQVHLERRARPRARPAQCVLTWCSRHQLAGPFLAVAGRVPLADTLCPEHHETRLVKRPCGEPHGRLSSPMQLGLKPMQRLCPG